MGSSTAFPENFLFIIPNPEYVFQWACLKKHKISYARHQSSTSPAYLLTNCKLPEGILCMGCSQYSGSQLVKWADEHSLETQGKSTRHLPKVETRLREGQVHFQSLLSHSWLSVTWCETLPCPSLSLPCSNRRRRTGYCFGPTALWPPLVNAHFRPSAVWKRYIISSTWQVYEAFIHSTSQTLCSESGMIHTFRDVILPDRETDLGRPTNSPKTF